MCLMPDPARWEGLHDTIRARVGGMPYPNHEADCSEGTKGIHEA